MTEPLAPAGAPHTATGDAGARRTRTILLAGNPNSGKTTVFNAVTGARAKVGNYPGVTVDRRVAMLTLPGGGRAELVDLPGTYSLSARSMEEEVAVDAVLGRRGQPPDVVVIAVDATALARGLYLAIQIAETGVPFVVGLTMMDEARSLGVAIDEAKLGEELGAECVPLVASRGEGLDALLRAAERALDEATDEPRGGLVLDAVLERDVEEVARVIDGLRGRRDEAARRAWALWALLSLGDDELSDVPDELRAAVTRVRERAADEERDIDLEIVALRYARVDAVMTSAVTDARTGTAARSLTDRIDGVLLHPIAGLVVFAAVMALVFESLFAWSDPMIDLIGTGISGMQDALASVLPAGPFESLLVDGVVAGVGNVVVFVPQIALLFFFIGVLEDSGYLARVAFALDRLMGGVGLHGKAFVPMLSGFACAIPAVMATRTIESRRDRLITMLVIPLTSCSARLPIYVLVIAAVFTPGVGPLVLFSMYALSVVAALGAASVLRRTVLAGPKPALVLELPPYRMPIVRNLIVGTWERVRTFLVDAGTVILALTIVLWALLSYPKSGDVTAEYDARRAEVARTSASADVAEARVAELDGEEVAEQLRYSAAGRLGRALEPVLEPLGFDWRIGIGILGAFAAREVFVSTLGIVFGIENADEESQSLRASLHEASWPDGRPLVTPLAGVSLMVFFVLACQCMSTVAVVRKESRSWRWPAFLVTYMSVLAYAASFLVFQVGSLLGWGTS